MINTDSPVKFGIVVPNWNGEAFLAQCLSAAFLSARRTHWPFEVVVVDDGSTDRSVEIIRRQFPRVILHARAENRGFAETVNEGVAAARGRLIVLLNNDVVIREDFCATLLEHFDRDARLFGVTAKTVQWDGSQPNYVKMDAVWARGDFRLVYSDPPEPTPTHFLQGGACAFVREHFLELGGLATFYAPAYWEDFDLSWQAWAHGWRNLYEPRSPALHLGKASFRQLGNNEWLAQLNARNHWLFTWANLADPHLMADHCARLPFRVAGALLHGGGTELRSFFRAARRIREVMQSRRRRAGLRTVSDTAILKAVDTAQSKWSG
ncbi:MAG: glycosyltransferase family 2 protein [Candidatus Sumerlaeia bacterium]|nr:glycosyltransferase family 2 protein [Candidatus Sumerlaeia bacterium]